MEAINVDAPVISRDKDLAVGHHRRAKLAVIEGIVRNVVAVPEQFQARRAVRVRYRVERAGIVGAQNSPDDVGVGVSRLRCQSPHDPGVWRAAIRGDDRKAARHTTLAAQSRRCDLRTLCKKFQLAGFAQGPGAQTLILAPYEQHRAMRGAAPKGGRTVQMMGLTGIEAVEISDLRRVDPKARKIREEQ